MHGLRRIPVKAFVSKENMTETDVHLRLLKQKKHSVLLILEYKQPENNNKSCFCQLLLQIIFYGNKPILLDMEIYIHQLVRIIWHPLHNMPKKYEGTRSMLWSKCSINKNVTKATTGEFITCAFYYKKCFCEINCFKKHHIV